MYPARFDYEKPLSLEEAVRSLTLHGGNAKLLAGGQSLIPSLKLRLARPDHLIDLAGIPALRAITVHENQLVVGAMATHWQVEASPEIRAVLPLLSDVAGVIADPQVRNRGTIGGSMVHADPAADYPASILALNARMICLGSAGTRIVEAADWFQSLMTTAIGDGEILTEIRIPLLPTRTAATYLKLPHPTSRFAVVGVAAIVSFSEDHHCVDVRIGVTGIGSIATRAVEAEQQLAGRRLDPQAIEAASRAACNGLEIDDDMHFSAEDKRQLCAVYVRRALSRVSDLEATGQFPTASDGAAGSLQLHPDQIL